MPEIAGDGAVPSAILTRVNRGNDVPGVHFLLDLIEPENAATVRARLGIGEPKQHTDEHAAAELHRLGAPRSALLWMLERDDPATNQLVFHHPNATDTLKRDILRGVPFGAARGPLPVPAKCSRQWCSHEMPQVPISDAGMIGGLREARTMGAARVAVRAVGKEDWLEVAVADLEQALPGYARWALTQRIDCPAEVRVQFGSHAKFAHRLRQAGIVELRDYVESSRSPEQVLGVLHFGAQLFPQRVGEVAELLGPLVRAEIGANPDAWAVLAQLLPRFAGSVSELVRTSGAIAYV